MEFDKQLEVRICADITMFDDLQDLGKCDDIDFLCRGVEVRLTFFKGFFHNDGVRYFMMLLDERKDNPGGEKFFRGCICTRESWPRCRMPNTDEERALVEEHFRLFQEEVQEALQHLDADEEDADVPY